MFVSQSCKNYKEPLYNRPYQMFLKLIWFTKLIYLWSPWPFSIVSNTGNNSFPPNETRVGATNLMKASDTGVLSDRRTRYGVIMSPKATLEGTCPPWTFFVLNQVNYSKKLLALT